MILIVNDDQKSSCGFTIRIGASHIDAYTVHGIASQSKVKMPLVKAPNTTSFLFNLLVENTIKLLYVQRWY